MGNAYRIPLNAVSILRSGMSRSRARVHLFVFIVGILLVASARGRGQAQPPRRFAVQANGLPAIDRGMVGTVARFGRR